MSADVNMPRVTPTTKIKLLTMIILIMLPLRNTVQMFTGHPFSILLMLDGSWRQVHVRLFLMVVVLAVHMFIYVCVCVCMKDQSEQWRGT